MLLTHLMRLKAEAGDRKFTVTEIFFEDDTGHLRYVALQTGGVFNREEVLVAIGAFAEPGETWRLVLDEAAVRDAPRWTEGEHSGPPVPLEGWPPVVIGPFGNTESPLMLWAQAAAAFGDEEGGEGEGRPPPSGDRRVVHLDRVTLKLDAPVFGDDGELGRLADLVIEPREMRITAFVVEDASGAHSVPWSALRRFPREGRHVVLALDRARLAAHPAP